jgi:hypothetical protein
MIDLRVRSDFFLLGWWLMVLLRFENPKLPGRSIDGFGARN